jgi:6-phosphogluconolactonase
MALDPVWRFHGRMPAKRRHDQDTLLVCHGDPQGQTFFYGYEPDSARLTPRPPGQTGASTSFATWHPSRRVMYGVQNRTDHVVALAVAAEPAAPALRVLNRAAVPPADGATQAGPAYLTTDPAGRFLLVANYRGHNVVVFALHPDGRVGPVVENVSDGKHAHLVRLTPDGRFALVPYLGSDLIAQYRFDPVRGALAPNDPPSVATAAGAGPRHLDFHPQQRDGVRHVFVINELDATLAAYALDVAAGTLSERCRVDSLPAGYDGQRWAAHVAVAPSGRFVYVCNRAHDSLTVFAWDGDREALQLVQNLPCGGRTPRHFTLDPGGRFLLVVNQDSGNLAVFAVDPRSGRLAPHAVHPVGALPCFVGLVPRLAQGGATL